MDDDLFDASSGKKKRHDGRDPWAAVTRARVLAEPELRAFVPGSIVADLPARWPPGAMVLILLERLRNDEQGRFEAVWCEVMDDDGRDLELVLDNQPTWIRGLASGDIVRAPHEAVLRVGT